MQKYFAHDNNAKIELDERVGETKSWMLKEKYIPIRNVCFQTTAAKSKKKTKILRLDMFDYLFSIEIIRAVE